MSVLAHVRVETWARIAFFLSVQEGLLRSGGVTK